MFQGTVSWAFFQVSKGSVSVLGAGQREGFKHTLRAAQPEAEATSPAAPSYWGHSGVPRKPSGGSSIWLGASGRECTGIMIGELLYSQ